MCVYVSSVCVYSASASVKRQCQCQCQCQCDIFENSRWYLWLLQKSPQTLTRSCWDWAMWTGRFTDLSGTIFKLTWTPQRHQGHREWTTCPAKISATNKIGLCACDLRSYCFHIRVFNRHVEMLNVNEWLCGRGLVGWTHLVGCHFELVLVHDQTL